MTKAPPRGWEERPLKHAATLSTDVLPENAPADYSFRYIDIGNVDSTGRIVATENHVFAYAPSRARKRVRPEDVIVSTVRTYLRAIAFIDQPADDLIVSTGFAVLRARPGMLPRFLWRALQSERFLDTVVAKSEGVSYPAIAPSELGRIRISVPPLEEQRAIVRMLDEETANIDALVATRGHLAEKLDEIDRTTVEAVFFPADQTGGSRPSQRRRLRDVVTLIQTGPFGSQLHLEDYVSGGIPVVNPQSISEDRIIASEKMTIDRILADKLSRHMLQKDDVIMARRGEMGRCALITERESGWLCGTGSMLIRPRPDVVLPAFLYLQLSSEYAKQWLTGHAVGTTMSNLSATIVSRVPVVVPPLHLQRELLNGVQSVRTKVIALRGSLQASFRLLTEYRSALITAAVTGKIDVTKAA